MSKRNLNRRQRWRIEQQQAERRQRAARGAQRGEAALEGGDLGTESPGTVIARYGPQADVRDGEGDVHRCFLRANLGSVVAGDRVTFCPGTSNGVVVAREDRASELRRPDKFGELRTIAANINQVVIVIAPLPEPHGNLIDRYLVATENLGARGAILVNKGDLLQDPELARAMDTLLEPYEPLGYPVIRASGKQGALGSLQALLAGNTSILVGQSGVGKTTLVNALLPEADERVGELSVQRAKGRHTTTTARLFTLPGGGALIDSPGIREFGLWHMNRDDVEHGFREFSDGIGQCQFRDCQHQSEPGCALHAALEAGRIHPARLASYRHIVASLDAFSVG